MITQPFATPTWSFDDLISTIEKLPSLDLVRFLKPHFPEEKLEEWDSSTLLELVLNLLQSWEPEFPSYNDFLIQSTASLCRASFEAFVRLFWDEVPVAQTLMWNWHLGVYTSEIQSVAEEILSGNPRSHDLVCNVSPGSSKSSVWSVLFPCWVWTRKPDARLITASHTEILATDLAAYAREVMRSVMYQMCFPDIEFTETQDAKGYYRNTKGGERFTCTVAGKSPTGHHAHFIICLPGEVTIITDRGCLPIEEIVDGRLPVKVLGYNHDTSKTEWQDIEEYEVSPGRPVCRIEFSDGTFIEATEEHPVYAVGRGYVAITELNPGDEVVYAVRSLQGLWGRGETSSEWGQEESRGVLYTQVLGGAQKESGKSAVSSMRECILSSPSSSCEEEGGRDVLFPRVYGEAHNRSKSLELPQESIQLRDMWKRSESYSYEDTGEVLQLQVSRSCYKRKEQSEVGQGHDKVREMWEREDNSPRIGSQGELLFQSLCEQGAFGENEWKGELQLHSWDGTFPLSDGVLTYEEESQAERWAQVFPLQEGTEGIGEGVVHTSCRSRQVQQCNREPCIPLCDLSQKAAWGEKESTSTSTKTIVSIVFRVRVPSKVYNLRIKSTHNYFANGVLLHNCDDPIDPKKVLSEAERKTASDFLTQVIPSRRMRGARGDVCATMLIMQRLGVEDPTDVMLKIAQKEGAAPVRHICLPAEITDDVSPKALRRYYESFNEDAGEDSKGLMDPVRLNRRVLNEQRSILGEWGYAGQYLQKPRPIAGGMFKRHYLQYIPTAPLRAKRIRYWDRASSSDSSACFTAGVLMAYDGEKFYVEDVVHDRWEPDERNEIMLATARKDRMRYGKYEPTIYVEAEGGSSGRDAWLGVARSLVGFSVREDRVQGSKDVRAEPWATQWAARNVCIVDNGESLRMGGRAGWDVEGYIIEHEHFRPEPGKRLGKWKDRTDASSGAFNLLVGLKRAYLPLYSYTITPAKKNQGRWIVACSLDELSLLDIGDQRALVVVFSDPPSINPLPIIDTVDLTETPRKGVGVAGCETSSSALRGVEEMSVELRESDRGLLPPSFPKYMDRLDLVFADLDPADYQVNHGSPIEPWKKPITELQMSREQAKKFWVCLMKKHEQPWNALIIVDQGGEDRRALSAAMAVADMLRMPRSAIFIPGYSNREELIEEEPPNQWVFEEIKTARHQVMVA